jgi:hypothetical protein
VQALGQAHGNAVAPTDQGTMELAGTTMNGSAAHILIGQEIMATVDAPGTWPEQAGQTWYYTWSISGGYPFSEYAPTADVAVFQQYTPPSNAAGDSSESWYFGQSSTNPIVISCTVQTPSGTFTAMKQVTVDGPTFTDKGHAIGTGQLYKSISGDTVTLGTPAAGEILWGGTVQYDGQTWTNGLLWDVAVTPPTGANYSGTGQWNFGQLITSATLTVTDKDGNSYSGYWSTQPTWPGPACDGAYPWQAPNEASAPWAVGTQDYCFYDAPCTPFLSWNCSTARSSSYQTYVFYTPPSATANNFVYSTEPVPVEVLAWGWSSNTTLNNGVWSINGDKPVKPTTSAWPEPFPTWSWLIAVDDAPQFNPPYTGN